MTVSAQQDDAETIRFAVRDTGEGIPAESFGRIFEKFGQLDSRRVGTGLGLAFCKLAVEAHGGRITVESTLGSRQHVLIHHPGARDDERETDSRDRGRSVHPQAPRHDPAPREL